MSYYRGNYSSSDVLGAFGGTICLFIFVILCFISCGRACSVGTGELRSVTATVTDKSIKTKNNDSTYLIYTETKDGIEVFQITDSLLAGRFNSSDVYAGIKVGKTYEFKVRGEREELMSWYPNIYEYREIEGE